MKRNIYYNDVCMNKFHVAILELIKGSTVGRLLLQRTVLVLLLTTHFVSSQYISIEFAVFVH